jgi:hypothetical protein
MTNAEKRERRRQAALKAAETRRQTAAEASAQAEDREAKRLINLRALLAEAQRIGREADLYYRAHTGRWSHHPSRWTPEQIDEARRFLAGFIRPDGTPQPVPHRKARRYR